MSGGVEWVEKVVEEKGVGMSYSEWVAGGRGREGGLNELL